VQNVEASIQRDAAQRNALVLAVTAVVLYVADQVTKWLVVSNIESGERVPVVGEFIQLWHVRNTGAAFSLFEGASWLFLPVHLLAIAMIIYFFRQFRDRGPWIHVVLGAILAGSLGNLTDRLRFGYVVDFVSVGIGDLRWPTFNVADPSLVIGILLLVAYLTVADGRGEADERHGPGDEAA
jgi:signal peptidase II